MHVTSLKSWVKERETPLADFVYRSAKALQGFAIPSIPVIHRPLYDLYWLIKNGWAAAFRILWATPLFQQRLTAPAPGLYLYGGIPLVLGPIDISVGARTRISGQTTFSARAAGPARPRLEIGSNVDVGWQTTIATGSLVRLGDNVRIAGRAFLAGYPGHPLNAEDRARGLPETEDQVGDIVLEDDVWLATGVTVSAGVTIGRGSVVAAGSVVTKDIPPGVLAAGVPAKVIRQID
ncbi:MAG: acyltransferase [Pseudomonadota bacterium]